MRVGGPAALAAVFFCAACDMRPPVRPTPPAEETAREPGTLGLAGGYGLAFPPSVAGFDRLDVFRRGPDGSDVTVGYALRAGIGRAGTSPVVATVRARPATGAGEVLLPGLNRERPRGSETGASQRELERSIRQVRAYYPRAELVLERPVFLVRRGALQEGSGAVLRFDDILAGREQPITLDIRMFCCAAGRYAYEYRFRHASDTNAEADIARFMQALPWSAE